MRDIPSTAFPHRLAAMVPTSEAFPGLDVKGKEEKKIPKRKKKEVGGGEANSAGNGNCTLEAGCLPDMQRGFFWGRVWLIGDCQSL